MSEEMEGLFDTDGVETEELRRLLIAEIVDYANNRPRNLQKEIGPSGIGTPCSRKLAYAVNYEDPHGPNKYTEVLPSLIGTSMHETMEKVLAYSNAKIVMRQQRERHKAGVFDSSVTEYENLSDAIESISAGKHVGPLRWLAENKVKLPIAGTCDVYDTWTYTIVDWKFLGNDTHGKYAKKGPPPTHYIVQVHTYGAGIVELGYRVDRVGIMMIPRSGVLRNSVLWAEKFDPDIAKKAVARVEAVKLISSEFNVNANPYKYRHIPATPSDSDCFFCPHFNPIPDANPYHCQGTAGQTDSDGHLIDKEAP